MDNDKIAKIIEDIIKRGNDVEIKTCKEGYKILEVKRKVAATIKINAVTSG